jgi:RNA polymerase sigma-70 factor, ECF subfamily
VDRQLVERAQRGDRDAFEALARGTSRRLYPVAYRIVRDADRADDVVQQALIAIWRDLRGLRDPDRFDAWSYRLLVRECIRDQRRTRRLGTRVAALDEDLPGGPDGVSDVATRDELDKAFRSLSPEHRAVLVLHHYLGMPLGEIAEIVGVPYGTVGSRIHHATRQMRAALEAGARGPVLGGQQA